VSNDDEGVRLARFTGQPAAIEPVQVVQGVRLGLTTVPAVRVETQNKALIGSGHVVRDHVGGVDWCKTSAGELHVFDGDGNELARYKRDGWLAVWRVPTTAELQRG
jgi:hypothetical protein